MTRKGRPRKIEPCPLCGSKAQLEMLDGISNTEKKRNYIHCSNQSCVICTWLVEDSGIKELVRTWNKRDRKEHK